eukprot:XP_011616787.1 PREDICTED: uncharacterized protein LOC105418635 isoform X1 [Takifugu rubripes]
MIWSVIFLVGAVTHSVESYAVRDLHERLVHGRQLKIYLPKSAEKLEFTPASDPGSTSLYWRSGGLRASKGRVSGTGSDRRWYIDKVTYKDEGTYTLSDFWNKEISTVRVAVTPRRNYVKCVAGESLYISLEGIEVADADLSFSGEYGNVTLVHSGARVSQDLANYWDRVLTHKANIEIRNVNYSDEGHYTLRDQRFRVVSVTRMDITDRHDYSAGNPLLGLLLLLGIPAGICCCCRKKIFKKKATTAATLQTSPSPAHTYVPSGPAGPCPPFNTPGQPGDMYHHGPGMGPTVHLPPTNTGPVQWNGPPPAPGMNPAYPPQNPIYPPTNPTMMPSPQWNGPPPGQYPPGPAVPMGYVAAPAMYSSAPPPNTDQAGEEIKMENKASSPTDALLTSTAHEKDPSLAPEQHSFTNPSASACKFEIDGEKTSTNFL